ncbi:MAG: hypothetical protein M3271_05805 [Actinomycetota bacterium]|nr:hypothetical protein [Actinomycetota bacterium]
MPPGAWVLLTDDGDTQSRTALVTARALASAGYRVAATVSGRHSLVGASNSCARAVPMPPISDPAFDEHLEAELRRGSYACVFPTSDAALLKLEPAVADLVDKRALTRRCRAAGISAPESTELPDPAALEAAADELGYPIVLKPLRSSWRPYAAGSPAELRAALPPDGPLLVQPYLTGTLRAVAGVTRDGALVAAVHQRYLRTWPPRCGGASAAVTVAPDEGLEERLVRLLDGRDGIFMAQLAGDVLFDLNPRVYGSLPLAVAAGANLPAIHCDLVRGAEVAPLRGRPGVRFRWLEGDVRHVWSQLRRGTLGPGAAVGALRPRRGTAHPVESLRDPGPMRARLRYALGRRR